MSRSPQALLLAAALLAPGFAFGAPQVQFESEPADLQFEGEFGIFDFASFDTGWVPGTGVVDVKFYLSNTGGVVSDFEATSFIGWPQPLTHLILGKPGTGFFGIDNTSTLGADLKIDIGIWSDTFVIWSESLRLVKTAPAYNPLLLANSPVSSQSVTFSAVNLFDPFEIDFSPITGVTITFWVDVTPELSAELFGDRIETESDGGISTITSNLEFGIVPVPLANPGWVDLESTYFGTIRALLDVIVTPGVDIDTWIGGFNLIQIDIALGDYFSLYGASGTGTGLVNYDQEWEFVTWDYMHPLPSALVLLSDYNFGGIEVGNLSNLQVPFRNVGLLELEGWARIEPPGLDISVFPEYLYSAPGETDGVVVTFGPQVEGKQEADLVIETSDPLKPTIIIPLIGKGYYDSDGDGDGDGFGSSGEGGTEGDGEGFEIQSDEKAISTCGCSSGGVASTTPWFLLAALALSRRRGH